MQDIDQEACVEAGIRKWKNRAIKGDDGDPAAGAREELGPFDLEVRPQP
jgi:hypothetical protein